MKTPQIFASLLAADFGALNADIARIEPFVDGLHFDIMDGHFVPNLTFGPLILQKIETRLPIEVHMMVKNPEMYIPDLLKKSVQSISFHVEAIPECSHMGGEGPEHRPWGHCTDRFYDLFAQIKAGGARAGLAISPDTDVHLLDEFLAEIDYVLVMGVPPGFGGQFFVPAVLEKVKYLRDSFPDLPIFLDGGMNQETAALVRGAGVEVIVSGSFLFGATDPYQAAQELRGDTANV